MNNQKDTISVCFVMPKAYPLFNAEAKGVFGGAEVDLYLLATELAKDELFDVSFVLGDYGQDDIEYRQGVKLIKSADVRKGMVGQGAKIWRAMKKADADIYMSEAASLGTSLIASFCIWNKRKYVYRTAHTDECDGTYRRKKNCQAKAVYWALRKASQVVTQNQSDAEKLLKTEGISSVVIKNATRIPQMAGGEKTLILWVSRSAEFKRPELFLKLAAEKPECNFTMICPKATGDDCYDELLRKARMISNLNFIERVPYNEIDRYYERAKVFVCTSESEGFPNTFIQACQNAVPILSLVVNPDDFINKNECGIACDGDWQKFVKSLDIMLAGDNYIRFGENARRYAMGNHDIGKIAEEYKAIFVRLNG